MAIPDDVKLTPWLDQYGKFKEQYPDTLLLFRMGDFYELFFDDARVAAAVLDIALTARDSEKKIPMAGVPHHALNLYLGRLIKAGYRAAICEQVGEVPAKGVVDRRVVRVVTPGTYVPEEGGDTSGGPLGGAGHLAAVLPLSGGEPRAKSERIAMALLSVETGRLEAGTLPRREAAALLSAFAPGEVLYPSNVPEKNLPGFIREFALRPAAPEAFKTKNASLRLSSALGQATSQGGAARLAGFGIDEDDPCVGPAWAVLDYLSATQFSAIRHVLRITPLLTRGRMSLDAAAQRNLELIPETASGPSLLSCLDQCRTPMGRRTLREWLLRPLMDVKGIGRRQDAIGLLVEAPADTAWLQDILAGTRDVERALSRLSLGAGGPRDLGAVRDTLRLLPDLMSLSNFNEPLAGLFGSFPDLTALREYLDGALEEDLPRALGTGPVIRSGFSAELASWRDVSGKGEAWLAEYVERERVACGSPRLRAGYNRAFGYYLEIGKAGLATVPPHFERRQTLVNAERYVTAELRNFQDKMARSEDEIARIEAGLYQDVVEHVVLEGADLQMTGRLLGVLDCLASCAAVARERSYVRPAVDESMKLTIRGGRHPVLETALTDTSFVPNDVHLGEGAPEGEQDARVIILTGPNMAGKSTWLRMTALLSIMAQAGLWVPAEEASFGLVDRVFTRIGARDDLVRGSSTFMVEMLETANILNNVTDRSLVILDEVGRGTATWDGMSIAWAVLEHLHGSSKARVLFATHCHELTCLEERLDGVKNYSMAVDEGPDGIVFLHQIVPGPADRSYGIEVARLAGLPAPVLRRAFELLEVFEKEGFERSAIPEPLPQKALKRQILLFSPETDAIVEELAAMDVDNMTPVRALQVLAKMKEKSVRAQDASN
ncbi:MAG: DNA mismatch repair protein MutS [Fretibacterium sp.]|nr:DNA mismatch repair protein MutS [Fretibacterium sp.]